jgi:hypothetical protein
MAYAGSCHCGAVTFEVDSEIPSKAISCNCSHCRRKGLLLTFQPASAFSLKSGDDSLIDYFFNKKVIRHRFCRTCGCQPFAEGRDKDGNDTRSINLRCVPECDLDALDIQKYDGASN